MTSATRQQRPRNPRPRPPAAAPVAARCKPTLLVTFRDQRVVAVERRHAARTPPARRTGDHLPEWQRQQDAALPFDEGCRGPCVGDREILPLTYFDKPR